MRVRPDPDRTAFALIPRILCKASGFFAQAELDRRGEVMLAFIDAIAAPDHGFSVALTPPLRSA
jgi:hypothetical protein